MYIYQINYFALPHFMHLETTHSQMYVYVRTQNATQRAKRPLENQLPRACELHSIIIIIITTTHESLCHQHSRHQRYYYDNHFLLIIPLCVFWTFVCIWTDLLVAYRSVALKYTLCFFADVAGVLYKASPSGSLIGWSYSTIGISSDGAVACAMHFRCLNIIGPYYWTKNSSLMVDTIYCIFC